MHGMSHTGQGSFNYNIPSIMILGGVRKKAKVFLILYKFNTSVFFIILKENHMEVD